MKTRTTTSDAAVEISKANPGRPYKSPDGFIYYTPTRDRENPPGVPPKVEFLNAMGWRPTVAAGWYDTDTYRWSYNTPSTPTTTWEDSEGSLPNDDESRLGFPMFDGLLAYFPNALAEVARISKMGNDQHNPGQPMHWARGKSTDHANKAVRHLTDHGKKDSRGARHTARAAWRILALLQEEIEADEGAPVSRASRLPEDNG